MKALLLLSVLISLASPVLARIGETREQCEARYGKPVKTDEEKFSVYYEKTGLSIICMFYEGKCDHVSFRHLEKDAGGKATPLSEAERSMLLESHSNGKQWSQAHKEEDGLEIWRCGDLEASFNSQSNRFLFICTDDHIKRYMSRGAAQK